MTWREDAVHSGPGHPELITIGVRVVAGRFLMGDYSGATSAVDGQTGSRASPAAAFGAAVRLWLEWPVDPSEQRRLRAHLLDLADSVGAAVWAPPLGGRAEILEGVRDPAARSRDGGVAKWTCCQPRSVQSGRFVTDADGLDLGQKIHVPGIGPSIARARAWCSTTTP
ncbi:hypothetical protein [Micromonospora sp. NPDC023814]|uniref:hypothetical protein n=1 Tax=Micromonospora sp. NPDC023814 TaxID=3154596 RepID=UPI0034066EBA